MSDEWKDDAEAQGDLQLTQEDVDVDVTEGADEMPMDEVDAELDNQDDETFQDDSIAAFYSHRKSVFCVQLHPKFPTPPLAVSGGEDDAAWIWNTIDGSEVAHLT